MRQQHTPSIDELRADVAQIDASLLTWTRLIKLTTVIFTILSAWLTAKGLYDMRIADYSASTEGMITASMTAIAAAVLVAVANILLYGLATLVNRRQRRRLVILTIAVMPFVFGISTVNAILASSSERSIILSLRDRTTMWEAHIATAMQDTRGAMAARSALLPLKTSLCRTAYGEKQNGLISGARGTGAIYAAYVSSCEGLGATIASLDTTMADSNARRTEIEAITRGMEAILRDTAITVYERQARYKDQDRALRKLLEDNSAERVSDRLMVELDMLYTSVASVGASSGAFGATQHAAINRLRDALRSVSAKVQTLLHSKTTDIAPAPAAMLSVEDAIARYWTSNVSVILISIACDTFSIWLICFIFTVRAVAQERKERLLVAIHAGDATSH